MEMLKPNSSAELAECLRSAASSRKSVQLGGNFTKDSMGGPIPASDVVVSTAGMQRILQYEPRDLTISVEAGMRWTDFCGELAKHQQMVPLDPPFFDQATVGGVVATNSSGPRRRLYGSARDVVIGMKFITLEGKVVQSGGMVVKNVAGLDMGKLMIGSFGTLAAMAVVNFKLAPVPEESRTFVSRFASATDAIAKRDQIVQGVLQPAVVDLLNPAAAARAGLSDWCLLIQAGGTKAVLDRYSRELTGADLLDSASESPLWTKVREFTPQFLADYPEGAVVRISTTLSGVSDVMAAFSGPAVARAANGVVYRYYEDCGSARLEKLKGVIEHAPVDRKAQLDQWPSAGSDFPVMQKLKSLFDPHSLLNSKRLYGRI